MKNAINLPKFFLKRQQKNRLYERSKAIQRVDCFAITSLKLVNDIPSPFQDLFAARVT